MSAKGSPASKKGPPKPLARSQSMAQFVSSATKENLLAMQELWNQLDSTNKGLISAADLHEFMMSVSVDASDEEVMELVKELDSDGDGKISFRDFARGVMRKQEQQLATPPPPAVKSPVSAKSPVSSPHSSPQLKSTKPQSPRAFTRTASVVHFVKHLTGAQMEQMQTLFDSFDTDHDGKIDYESVKSIVRDINPDFSKSDMQALLTSIDSDLDGLVNFKEFIDGTVMVFKTKQKQAEKVKEETKSEEEPSKSKNPAVAELQAQVAERDKTIEQLREEILKLRQENNQLKTRIMKLK